jgi:hypothetical protein
VSERLAAAFLPGLRSRSTKCFNVMGPTFEVTLPEGLVAIGQPARGRNEQF